MSDVFFVVAYFTLYLLTYMYINFLTSLLKANCAPRQCTYYSFVCAQQVKAIAETGCKVVVTGGKVGEMYLHYANKYRLMVVRLLTKFDLRRLCKSIGASPLPRLVSMLLLTLLFICLPFVKNILL